MIFDFAKQYFFQNSTNFQGKFNRTRNWKESDFFLLKYWIRIGRLPSTIGRFEDQIEILEKINGGIF